MTSGVAEPSGLNEDSLGPMLRDMRLLGLNPSVFAGEPP